MYCPSRAATLKILLAALSFTQAAVGQSTVFFSTQDGGVIFADLYGTGRRGVVLAHGGQFNKESWASQAQTLVAAGFQVLAIDFRGYGKSHGPGDSDPMDALLQLDVLAAVRYLHGHDAKTVSVVGGSMGGSAAGDASIAFREVGRAMSTSRVCSCLFPISHKRSMILPASYPTDSGLCRPRSNICWS